MNYHIVRLQLVKVRLNLMHLSTARHCYFNALSCLSFFITEVILCVDKIFHRLLVDKQFEDVYILFLHFNFAF